MKKEKLTASKCLPSSPSPIKRSVLVFDLDDTLYPELSYVHSGFRAVAAFLSPLLGVPAVMAANLDPVIAIRAK